VDTGVQEEQRKRQRKDKAGRQGKGKGIAGHTPYWSTAGTKNAQKTPTTFFVTVYLTGANTQIDPGNEVQI
jgi:hypothetical protein